MSITGNAAAKKILRGKLSATEMVYIDAYELACIHGFKGTIEEWLEAVMGHSGVPGRDGYSPTLEVTPITGGIRVTVTNKDGTDVKDIKFSASDLGAVPTSRTINGKALSGNISLSASDVGAVPTHRTINGKALSGNITLSASDVNARPSNWMPTADQVEAVSKKAGTSNNGKYLTVINGLAMWRDAPSSGDGGITVDSVLDLDSTNPVQNKVITAELLDRVRKSITVNGQSLSADVVLDAHSVGAVSSSPGALFDDRVLTVANGQATWVHPAAGFYSAFSLDKDSTYTDCFYRQVFNTDSYIVENEWLNPPMVVNTEYRTVERHKTKPVYTMLIKMGTAPEVGTALIIEIPDAKRIIRAEAYADDGEYYKIIPRKDSAYEVTLSVGSTVASRGDSYVEINVISGSLSGYDCFAQVWYTK